MIKSEVELGIEIGIERERERIIDMLEDLREMELLTTDDYIALIKGEGENK